MGIAEALQAAGNKVSGIETAPRTPAATTTPHGQLGWR